MTCAGYPQIVGQSHAGPRSIVPGVTPAGERLPSKTIRIQRAARDMNSIMADPYPIRPITDDEYAHFRRVHEHAFNGGPAPPARGARLRRQFEAERSLAAFDAALPAGELVGTTGVYSLADGGARRGAARSPASPLVSVLPTHRRRGILRSLMPRQLAGHRGPRRGAGRGAVGLGDAASTAGTATGGLPRNACFRFGRGEGGAVPRRRLPTPRCALRLARACGRCPADLAKVYEPCCRGSRASSPATTTGGSRVLDDRRGPARASPLRCVLAEDGSGCAATRCTGARRAGTRDVLPDACLASGS